ncbi:MAG: hypothetical protein IKR17_13120 [Bacteroidales bacterium]|nr:hypothetical protein [Bacteroidales bacterium]
MKKINLLSFCFALLLPCAVATAENVVTLTEETEAITLADGDVLTGTGGANTHVSIADGASVTLSNVTIAATTYDEDHKWAGLTCLGNATITLADGTTNTIKGGHETYPGIYVAEGYTLTIEGNTGILVASSNVNQYEQSFGAGIGGGRHIDCGNITINGGVINATGGYQAAAIGGGGYSSYGSITINGGTITAIGGEESAGIGCGNQGHVQYDYDSDDISIISNITITGGTIIATGGGSYGSTGGAGIGVGGTNGECGNITISGGHIKATGGSGAAGIGCGYCFYSNSVCGNITISGGTIEATGGEGAAAIGCGVADEEYGSYEGCKSITITADIAKLQAVKGTGALDCIGRSVASKSACGSVTIGGVTYWNQEYNEYDFVSDGEYQNGGEAYLTSESIVYPSIATPSVTIAAATYNGEAQSVVVKDGETTLTLNEDYTATLSENGYINAGNYTIAITGLGKYENTYADKTFTINPKELTAANVANIASQTYTGESLTPVVVVTDGATTLSEDVDYYVKGPKMSIVDADSYIHTVVGMGNYSGEVDKSFEITKADPEEPENLVATQDQTLAEVELPEGWAWVDASTNVGNEIGDKTFPATYAGSTNYKATTADLTVTVSRGAVTAVNGVDAEKQHAKKYIENGILIIEVDGVKYDVTGRVVK